ncbi:MAG: amidase, partial [Chloroflexi bacterium]
MTFAEIRFCTAAELAAALRKRRISAVEVARASLDLLGKLGPKYNAVAALTTERALDEAKRADVAIAKKQGGPLTGIPYGAKDL